MGVVYAGHDERLDRPVAIKTVRAENVEPEARERLKREARIAASVNHPNICQLYEIGEDSSGIYIAMELLEGEALSTRIGRSPLPVPEALDVARGMLSALAAMHRRGLIHRDLKPSNIFLTPHGVKLLDFGIAQPSSTELQGTVLPLTAEGIALGTPQYMAPEHASGAELDNRSDLFAVGAVLYEMLSGRPAFDGSTPVRVLHAVLYEQPPALAGSSAVAAVDRVIHRALAKQPLDRFATAEEFAADLRQAMGDTDTSRRTQARPMTRVIVLPFRLLRNDPEIDFLGYSLADAVTTSLSGLGSVVVRSSLTAAKFGSEPADLEQIARDVGVDAVLSGTLLRAGSQLRLNAQLAATPGGAVLWSKTVQVSADDIFHLHDTLVRELVEALSVRLTIRDHRTLDRDVPASTQAYEFYLRANELARRSEDWSLALDLYRQCVALDPQYAPAWAQMGRVYRLVAKYRDVDQQANQTAAEHALQRALTLNPDLSFAHNVLAYLEVESGRAIEAMVRLLEQSAETADPNLFAGLCHACRYCGLLEASVAAHEHARRLDPKAVTSVINTFFHLRDFDRVLACGDKWAPLLEGLAIAELGRPDEAVALLRRTAPNAPLRMREFMDASVMAIEGADRLDAPALETLDRAFFMQVTDPEGLYYASRLLAHLGQTDIALREFVRAVNGGYFLYTAFTSDPWLANLRGRDAFEAAVDVARRGHQDAVAAFKKAGGERIVGIRL